MVLQAIVHETLEDPHATIINRVPLRKSISLPYYLETILPATYRSLNISFH